MNQIAMPQWADETKPPFSIYGKRLHVHEIPAFIVRTMGASYAELPMAHAELAKMWLAGFQRRILAEHSR